MKCAGCQRNLEVGDQYIEATASEFMGREDKEGMNDLIAMVMGSGRGVRIVYCEDCTESGGKFLLQTFYGDEDDE